MPPTLFDERLSARVDTILTATAAILLMLIEVVGLANGSRVDAPYMFALVALGCLSWTLARRFHRLPLVAFPLVLAAICMVLDLGWLRSHLPGFLQPTLHAFITCAFIFSARLPRFAAIALVTLALGLTAARFFDLGLFGHMVVYGQPSDLHVFAVASPLVLWLLIAISARPRPLATQTAYAQSDPMPHPRPTATPTPRPLWSNRPHTWWRYYRVAILAHMLLGLTWATFRFTGVPYEDLAFSTVFVLAGCASLALLSSRLLLLRLIEGRPGTSFWGAQDIIAKTLLLVVALLLAVQTYDLVTNEGQWQAPILGVTRPIFQTSTALSASIALLFLLQPAPRATSPERPRPVDHRRTWAHLGLGSMFFVAAAYALIAAAELTTTSTTMWLLTILSGTIGVVAEWGVLRTLHHDIEQAAMAETFSAD